MYLGIDIGTSAVKLVLVNETQQVVAQASQPLEVQRPHPLWAEQDPEEWWQATSRAMAELRRHHAAELGGVRALGLSGQMHGATLLDARDAVLRPAILWNDGRSAAQCAELERREPRARMLTGNLAMPGFTAPKLLWVAQHEPDVFKRIAHVLLPKDYVRLRLSGDYVSDMSDAAGTLWLDVGKRQWSADMLEATALTERSMPHLCEGSEATGTVRPELAAAWGMPRGVVIAAGAGDNAGGAVGVGVVSAGQGLISLGTSGVYFVASDRFLPCPERTVHAFCHALPQTWHQMSVMLSAASCLSWVTALTGATSEAALLAEVEAVDRPAGVIFLPYLSGERTPHNDPDASGVFVGLRHDTTRAELGRAVLEGVAFAFADGQEALAASGTPIGDVCVIGGGARSSLWGRILASVLGRALTYGEQSNIGPAFGAARLARLAVTAESPSAVCLPLPAEHRIEPDPELRQYYATRLQIYRRVYRELKDTFAALRAPGMDSQ